MRESLHYITFVAGVAGRTAAHSNVLLGLSNELIDVHKIIGCISALNIRAHA